MPLGVVQPASLGYTSAYLTWSDPSGACHTFYPDGVLSEEWSETASVTEHPVEQGADVVDHVRVELVKCTLTIFATNEPIGPNNWDTPSQQSFQLQGLDSAAQGTDGGNPVTARVWKNNLALRATLLAAGGAAGALIGSGAGGAKGGVIGNVVGGAAGAIAGALLAQPYEEDKTFTAQTGMPPAPTVTGQATLQAFGNPQDYVELTINLLATLKSSAQIIGLVGSKQSMPAMVIEDFSYTRSSEEGTGATITIGLKEVRFVQTQVTTAPLPAYPGATQPTTAGTQNPSDGTPQQQESVASAAISALTAWAQSLFGGGG